MLGGEYVDDEGFNNNGKRQKSVIPFLEAEDGVVIKEQGGGQTDRKQFSARVSSASATHRTFKSYTK